MTDFLPPGTPVTFRGGDTDGRCVGEVLRCEPFGEWYAKEGGRRLRFGLPMLPRIPAGLDVSRPVVVVRWARPGWPLGCEMAFFPHQVRAVAPAVLLEN